MESDSPNQGTGSEQSAREIVPEERFPDGKTHHFFVAEEEGTPLGPVFTTPAAPKPPDPICLRCLKKIFRRGAAHTMSHRKLHFLCGNRYAEKRDFRLAHTTFGGAPDWCPAARTV